MNSSIAIRILVLGIICLSTKMDFAFGDDEAAFEKANVFVGLLEAPPQKSADRDAWFKVTSNAFHNLLSVLNQEKPEAKAKWLSELPAAQKTAFQSSVKGILQYEVDHGLNSTSPLGIQMIQILEWKAALSDLQTDKKLAAALGQFTDELDLQLAKSISDILTVARRMKSAWAKDSSEVEDYSIAGSGATAPRTFVAKALTRIEADLLKSVDQKVWTDELKQSANSFFTELMSTRLINADAPTGLDLEKPIRTLATRCYVLLNQNNENTEWFDQVLTMLDRSKTHQYAALFSFALVSHPDLRQKLTKSIAERLRFGFPTYVFDYNSGKYEISDSTNLEMKTYFLMYGPRIVETKDQKLKISSDLETQLLTGLHSSNVDEVILASLIIISYAGLIDCSDDLQNTLIEKINVSEEVVVALSTTCKLNPLQSISDALIEKKYPGRDVSALEEYIDRTIVLSGYPTEIKDDSELLDLTRKVDPSDWHAQWQFGYLTALASTDEQKKILIEALSKRSLESLRMGIQNEVIARRNRE